MGVLIISGFSRDFHPLAGHQFPDDAYISDTVIVALISVAVLFPVSGILQQLMELSNEVMCAYFRTSDSALRFRPSPHRRRAVSLCTPDPAFALPWPRRAADGWQETPSRRLLRTLLGGKDGHRRWHWFFPAPGAPGSASLFARKVPMSRGYTWLLEHGDSPIIVLLWHHLCAIAAAVLPCLFCSAKKRRTAEVVVGQQGGKEKRRKRRRRTRRCLRRRSTRS